MNATVEQWREVIALLRSWGFVVEEVPGWERRGLGAVRVLWAVWHHTAGPQKSGARASLHTVTFGRPGLRNALCNTYTDRDGVIFMVAARLAYHAGKGIITSNSTSTGHEAENDGVGEVWKDRHYWSQVALAAAESLVFGLDASHHIDHREHAPGRKIDRTGINSDQFRRDVASFIAAKYKEATVPLSDEDIQRIRQAIQEDLAHRDRVFWTPIKNIVVAIARKLGLNY